MQTIKSISLSKRYELAVKLTGILQWTKSVLLINPVAEMSCLSRFLKYDGNYVNFLANTFYFFVFSEYLINEKNPYSLRFS